MAKNNENQNLFLAKALATLKILAITFPIIIRQATLKGLLGRTLKLLGVYVFGCLTLDLPGAFYLVGVVFLMMYFFSMGRALDTNEFKVKAALLARRS